MLCRRSFHCDGSPSLRLFALGLRANKSRLLGPCCLGGSPSRFIDQARGVLLFVFSFSLIFIFCFLIFLFSFASPCGGVLFLLLVSRDVSSFLLSSLGFCTRVLSALRPSLVRPFEFTCGVLRICSVCCTHAWFVFGVAGKQFALALFSWEGNLPSITVSSAYCLVRLASCPLHSA